MQIRRHLNFSLNSDYPLADADSEPQNILEKIVWHKEKEVAVAKQNFAIGVAISYLKSAPPVRNFAQALKSSSQKPALIAEVKKASPSRGVIRSDFDPVAIAKSYQNAGATCLSVLTDREFFAGSFENLFLIRNSVDLPLLCKEFVIDEYQIYLARLHGADAILLITAILSDRDLQKFSSIARELGMSILVEVHTEHELERVLRLDSLVKIETKTGVMIGINNRNLETFAVEITNTEKLLAAIDQNLKFAIFWVSESGIYTNQDLQLVKKYGANAVLVGESLIKQNDIEAAVKSLLAI